MSIPLLKNLVIITGVFISISVVTCADEIHEKAIEQSLEKYAEEYAEAGQQLLEEFDDQITSALKNRRLNSDQKDLIVKSLEAERADYKKYGTLLFSPMMRDGAIRYLKSLGAITIKAEKSFDEAIEFYQTEEGDGDAADNVRELRREKIGRKLIGTWNFPGYSVPLYNDGTAGPDRIWSLYPNRMVIRHKTQKAPKGVWVDVGIIEVSGKECQIKNQKGTVKNGVLVNPSAPDTGSNTEP